MIIHVFPASSVSVDNLRPSSESRRRYRQAQQRISSDLKVLAHIERAFSFFYHISCCAIQCFPTTKSYAGYWPTTRDYILKVMRKHGVFLQAMAIFSIIVPTEDSKLLHRL